MTAHKCYANKVTINFQEFFSLNSTFINSAYCGMCVWFNLDSHSLNQFLHLLQKWCLIQVHVFFYVMYFMQWLARPLKTHYIFCYGHNNHRQRDFSDSSFTDMLLMLISFKLNLRRPQSLTEVSQLCLLWFPWQPPAGWGITIEKMNDCGLKRNTE